MSIAPNPLSDPNRLETGSHPSDRPQPGRIQIDLKRFVQQLSAHRTDTRPTTSGYRRIAHLVERDGPQQVSSRPLRVTGFLDGQQIKHVVARTGRRDVTLVYISAGTVAGRDLLNVEERLAAICSEIDAGQVQAAGPDVPVVALPEVLPWDLSAATDAWVDQTRRTLETSTLAGAPSAVDSYLALDGALPPDGCRADVVSVIKSVDTDWLTDTDDLPFDAGWRSPALRLPVRFVGDRDRLTCYLRLRSAGSSARWDSSLIRLEVYADAGIATLDAACAMAMTQRQPLSSGDPRAAVHLWGFRRAEQVLKARAPSVLQLL